MKRIGLLFGISLLIAICCSSQTTYPYQLTDSTVVITNQQLKQTNLIFNEHKFLIQENKSLKDKLVLSDSIVSNYQVIDSIQIENIAKLSVDNLNLQNQLKKKSMLKNQPGFWIGIGGIIIGTILSIIR